MADYAATRDRLSDDLFRVTDEIATYAWDIDEVPSLMRRVSAAMTDEVEYLESLPAWQSGMTLAVRALAFPERGGRTERGTGMDVDIALLGGFSVVRDGAPVADEAWSRRGAASLVKLLALADGRRLHRERVIDALWPGLPVEAAGPRLHKAAHYARRALGDVPDALLLRQDQVVLLADHRGRPSTRSSSSGWAEAALASGSVDDAETALAAYGGPLLPEDPYESWAAEARESRPRCTRTCCAWPVAGKSWSGRTRSTRRPTSRWPASTPTAWRHPSGPAPAGADGPGRAPGAGHGPERRHAKAPRRAHPRGGSSRAGRAARTCPRRTRRRGRVPPRAAGPGRRRTRRQRDGHGSRRRGQDARCST